MLSNIQSILRALVCLFTILLFFGFNDAFSQCNYTIAASVTNVACNNGTNGSVIATVTDGTAPYQYQLAEGAAVAWQTSNSFTALSAGVYPLSVKDATGCIKTIYTTITQPAALVTTYSATDATCAGSNNGAITTSTSGGVAPYTYNWTKDGTAFATTPNISALSPGNYFVTATDANGCSTTPVITSNVRPISLTGFNEDVVANGTSVAANASTTQPVDQNTAVFYATGYSNSNGTGTAGLPASGSFTSAQDNARTYQLASYSSSNSLLLRSSTANLYGGAVSGTLSFTSPYQSPYATLYVVGTTGSGTGTVNYMVSFADGTTQTGSLTYPDWYLTPSTSSSQRALGNLDRVSFANPGAYTGSTNFNLFELPITIPPANQGRVINSVDFSWSAASNARVSLFAITGYTSTLSIRINNGPSSGVTPSVSITSNAPANTFCSSQPVTFTATPSNSGSSPAYQWKLNGANVGSNTTAYTNNALPNNAQVSVVITSTLSCLTTASATSNIAVMTQGTVTPSVAVSSSGNTICSGTTTTFTATPVNEGTSPAYQWKLNGSNVGTNSPTYSNASLNNNNQVTVSMTSSIGCATGNPATGNTVTMSVSPNATPAVTISSQPAIRFSSTSTFPGTSPAYQWFRNGTAIQDSTRPALVINNPTVGDIYSLKMTSSYGCKTEPATKSNYITVTPSTLPVILEWYNASVTDGKVLLTWKTSLEVRNKAFQVQRATAPSGKYETIGQVPANGNQPGSYSYPDEPTYGGTYLYRLVQLDQDGNQSIVGIRSATIVFSTAWKVFDKGSEWQLKTSKPSRYLLIDEQGKLINHGASLGTATISKPVTGKIFILRVEMEGKFYSRKLVK